MKKLLVLLLTVFLIVSCQPDAKKEIGHKHNFAAGVCTCGEYAEYELGNLGPAGGYIFYDVDADNTEEDPDGLDNLLSSDCGWRYLEAAPSDVTIAGRAEDKGGENCFSFGYFRTQGGSNLTAETSAGIGSGKENSDSLLQKLNTTGVDKYWNSDKSRNEKIDYAAVELSASYGVDGFEDWFLPSVDELYEMMKVLFQGNVCTFASDWYWSSTEDGASYAKAVNFDSNYTYSRVSERGRGGMNVVRAVRRF